MDPGYADPQIMVAVVYERPSSKDELLAAVARALHFPDYFGFNWDALHDCLSDLSWLTQTTVILVHAGGLGLPASDLETYCEIVDDAMKQSARSPRRFIAVCRPPPPPIRP